MAGNPPMPPCYRRILAEQDVAHGRERPLLGTFSHGTSLAVTQLRAAKPSLCDLVSPRRATNPAVSFGLLAISRLRFDRCIAGCSDPAPANSSSQPRRSGLSYSGPATGCAQETSVTARPARRCLCGCHFAVMEPRSNFHEIPSKSGASAKPLLWFIRGGQSRKYCPIHWIASY